MPEAIVAIRTRGASPREWQFQALVAAYNAIPALPLAVVFAYLGLVTGVVTGGVGWFLGAVAIAFTFAYFVFCFLVSSALWRHKNWARFAAVVIFLLYLLLHWAVSSAQHKVLSSPQPLKPPTDHTIPEWAMRIMAFMRFTLHFIYLLPFANVVALAHSVVRWKQFSRSVDSG